MDQHISVRIADVQEELTRVLTHLREFPSPGDVERIAGPTSESVRHFYAQLGSAARTAGAATEKVMEELSTMDSTIRAALRDITDHDAELASTATWFEAFLDSASEAPPGDSPGPGVTRGSSGGANLRSRPPGGEGEGHP